MTTIFKNWSLILMSTFAPAVVAQVAANLDCRPRLETTSVLPDPRAVDPRSIVEILDFLRDVGGMPPNNQAYALRTGFENVWRLFHPHLTDAGIARHLATCEFTQAGRRNLARAKPAKSEINRLVHAWRVFVDGLDPSLQAAAREAHFERVAKVALGRFAIIDFLAREYPEVKSRGSRMRAWFDRLYADFAPHARTPVEFGREDHHLQHSAAADRRVLRAWQHYVFAATGRFIEIPAEAIPVPRVLRTKMVERVPLTIAEVGDSVHEIIAFLANRYRHISIREAGALPALFLAFASEFEIEPNWQLLPRDFRRAYYKDEENEAQRRVKRAWRSCLDQLNARAR